MREDDRREEGVLPEEGANGDTSEDRAFSIRDNAHSLVVVLCSTISACDDYICTRWPTFDPGLKLLSDRMRGRRAASRRRRTRSDHHWDNSSAHECQSMEGGEDDIGQQSDWN